MDPSYRTLKSHGQCDEGMEIQHPEYWTFPMPTAGYDKVAFRLNREVLLEG